MIVPIAGGHDTQRVWLVRPPFCLLRRLEWLCHRRPNDNQIDAEGTYHSHNHLFKMRSRLISIMSVTFFCCKL